MTRIFKTIVSKAFKDGNFSMEMQGMAPTVVQATMHVYKSAIANLLPTPTKSHYTFNLRDFARVVNGVLLMDGTRAGDKNKLCRLWCHEVYRVFGDRLVFEEDHAWLFQLLKDTTSSHFKSDFDNVMSRLGSKCKYTHIDIFRACMLTTRFV
jgi:dynein heavy chain